MSEFVLEPQPIDPRQLFGEVLERGREFLTRFIGGTGLDGEQIIIDLMGTNDGLPDMSILYDKKIIPAEDPEEVKKRDKVAKETIKRRGEEHRDPHTGKKSDGRTTPKTRPDSRD